MMPLLLALGFHGERRAYLARLVLLWGCFGIAVVTCFAIKMAIAGGSQEHGRDHSISGHRLRSITSFDN